MLPRFRKGILALQCNDPDPEDSFIYQFQTVFGFLQESSRRFFNPEYAMPTFVILT